MIRINKLFCLQTLFTDCQNFTKDGYFEGNLDKQSGENIIFQTAVKKIIGINILAVLMNLF